MVRVDSEKHIDFSLTSPFGGGRPGRVKRKNMKNAAKKAAGGDGDEEDEEWANHALVGSAVSFLPCKLNLLAKNVVCYPPKSIRVISHCAYWSYISEAGFFVLLLYKIWLYMETDFYAFF